MVRYLIERFIYLFISILLIITLTFLMIKALPGDPFTEEKALAPEVLTKLKEHYNLSLSVGEQYLIYLRSVFSGDFGTSMVYPSRSVCDIILDSFPISAIIGLQAIFVSATGGILLGILLQLNNQSRFSPILTLTVLAIISIPSFIAAPLLQYFFAIRWDVLPLAKWGSFSHTILPTLSLAAFPMAVIARLVDVKLSEVLKSDYITLAEAKGLSKFRILFRHALPNTLAPVVGYLGQTSAAILTGSFVVERIFGIPGLGTWYVASILNRDYPLIMGTTLFYSLVLITLIFISDLLYLALDPRLRRRYE